MRSVRIQREAVAAIKSAGGRVSYESQIYPSTIWWPDWLETQLGIEYLDRVNIVDLSPETTQTWRTSGVYRCTA